MMRRKNTKDRDTGWWLDCTPLKNMSSSIGMMRFPIYGKMPKMFQTTNQDIIGILLGYYDFSFWIIVVYYICGFYDIIPKMILGI